MYQSFQCDGEDPNGTDGGVGSLWYGKCGGRGTHFPWVKGKLLPAVK